MLYVLIKKEVDVIRLRQESESSTLAFYNVNSLSLDVHWSSKFDHEKYKLYNFNYLSFCLNWLKKSKIPLTPLSFIQWVALKKSKSHFRDI